MQTLDTASNHSAEQSAPLSPESGVAMQLAALGDQINEQYGSSINTVVQELLDVPADISYEQFMCNIQGFLESNHLVGWSRVSVSHLIVTRTHTFI